MQGDCVSSYFRAKSSPGQLERAEGIGIQEAPAVYRKIRFPFSRVCLAGQLARRTSKGLDPQQDALRGVDGWRYPGGGDRGRE